MEPLTIIMERLAERIDYVLSHPPRTERKGADCVTTFGGREYRNLSYSQVNDLSRCAYDDAYSAWEEARRYDQYLYHHFTPTADYFLRTMGKKLI